MPAGPDSPPPTPIPIKVLGILAGLMLAAVLYNGMGGGWRNDAHGARGYIHEAAVPLQKRVRPSKFKQEVDPDMPDQVVVGAKEAVPTTAETAAEERRKREALLATANTVPTVSAVPAAAAAAAPHADRNAAEERRHREKESLLRGDAAPATAAAASAHLGLPPTEAEFAQAVDSAAFKQQLAQTGETQMESTGLSCHARQGYDIAGDAAYVWGLAFNVASAAECCAACATQRHVCARPANRGKPFWRASRREKTQGRCSGSGVCNAWVFCPGSPEAAGFEDRCFSYTIHNHTKGECWLKHEANESYPIAAGPTLPVRMRRAARKDWPWAVATNVWPWEVPEKVPWQAGIVARREAPVWKGTRKPDWHHKFCNKHGC